MLKSLAASSRAKTQRIVLDTNEHCSITGKLFNETVNVSRFHDANSDAGKQGDLITTKVDWMSSSESCPSEQPVPSRRPQRHCKSKYVQEHLESHSSFIATPSRCHLGSHSFFATGESRSARPGRISVPRRSSHSPPPQGF